ncbi:MAG: (2Fe-2S)-binding protein [Actinobacteria bacterium]|nr:(2Fe-2S)-binding protein [Actinomycetota bacterium]
MRKRIRLIVNGRSHELEVETHHTLLEVLRDQLDLVGAKESCGVGVCGGCTVIAGGRAISSCTALACLFDGEEIQTIEGLTRGETIHPLQQTFIDHNGFQCGYCTSGMIMSAKSLLDINPAPSVEEIRDYLSGNLCRCGAYSGIIKAVQATAGSTK